MSAEKIFLSPSEIRTRPEWQDGYEAVHGLIASDATNFPAGFFPRGLLVCEVSSGVYDPYINNAYKELSTGESAWTAGSGVTASQDEETPTATQSIKLVVADGAAAGVVAGYLDITSINISAGEFAMLWFKSSIALDAGDYNLLTDDTSACVSPDITQALPAIKANTWTFIVVAISSGAAATVSVGLEMNVDKGAHTVWVGDIRTADVQSSAAAGVLKEDVYFSNLTNKKGDYNGTANFEAQIFTHGSFFKDKVLGYDAAAKTDLSGTLSQNSTVFLF